MGLRKTIPVVLTRWAWKRPSLWTCYDKWLQRWLPKEETFSNRLLPAWYYQAQSAQDLLLQKLLLLLWPAQIQSREQCQVRSCQLFLKLQLFKSGEITRTLFFIKKWNSQSLWVWSRVCTREAWRLTQHSTQNPLPPIKKTKQKKPSWSWEASTWYRQHYTWPQTFLF